MWRVLISGILPSLWLRKRTSHQSINQTMKLLNSGNAKTVKGEKWGFKTFGIHLAPSKLSGHNVCLWASKGCAMACLNTAGRGAMSNVQKARINKTKLFFQDKDGFMTQLIKEIASAVKSSAKAGLTPCFRLNLTSDIPWEGVRHEGKTIFEIYPHCQFYDYTKGSYRMHRFLDGKLPSNYHLTFSRSEETSTDRMTRILEKGGNVAVVFRGKLPRKYLGYHVINGDEDDLRFKDGDSKKVTKGLIIGLVEKGLAKKDKTGFVVEPK